MTLETDNLWTGKEEVYLPLSPVLLKGKPRASAQIAKVEDIISLEWQKVICGLK